AGSVIAATSSSRFVVPNYWADPKTGIGFQVQVEIPTARMNSARQVEMVPLRSLGGDGGQGLLVRDVATVREGTMPGESDRYNRRRLVSLTANVAGEDLGRVERQIDRAVRAAEAELGPEKMKELNLRVDVRGQIVPMRQMFTGLTVGLGLAVA